jgi:hypothetical protein
MKLSIASVALLLVVVVIGLSHAWVSPTALRKQRLSAWQLQAAVGIYFGTSVSLLLPFCHRIIGSHRCYHYACF